MSITAALLMFTAACGGSSSSGQQQASGPPVKLGMIDTISGSLASVGNDGQAGAKVAVDQINKAGGVLGGRKLELDVQDEALNPTATVKAVRDLNSQGANLLFGFTSSSDMLAAVPVAKQLGMAIVAAHASATPLRTKNFEPNFAAVANSDYLSSNGSPDFLHKQFPNIHTWNVFSYDYLTGHEGWNLFKSKMKDRDPQFNVNKEVFIPQTASDLTPYITSMLSALPTDSGNSQGVYIFLFGAGEVNLFKQGAPYNLDKRFKVILTSGGGYEALANTLKTETPTSWVGYDYSYKGFNNAMNTKFIKDFEAANNGTPPDAWSEQSYATVYMYKAALEKAKSDDPAKVWATFGGLSFDSPMGTLKIDPKTHQSFVPMTFTEFAPDPSSPQGWKESEAVVIWPPASAAIPPSS
ncbi:MAG: ABC transporter substrate-binding protein [Candidatus Woesearchaeota archaeon]